MIEEFNGEKVDYIDELATIIRSQKGNIAKGVTINADFTLQPCFVATVDGYSAHGKTAQEAVREAQIKAFEKASVEERIAKFIALYPSLNTPVPNEELFKWHGNLTLSCAFGREQFIKNNNIELCGSSTVAEFIEKTTGHFGSEIMQQLKETYND